MSVRPEVLRSFYEATYGKGATNVTHSANAFCEATFDEYVTLMRIFYPKMTPHTAASQAFALPAFRSRAATLQPAIEEEDEVLSVFWEPPRRRPRGANAVSIGGRSGAVDLAPMRSAKPVRVIYARRAKTPVSSVRSPLAVQLVDVDECAPALVESLLAATNAKVIWWIEPRTNPVDLSWLEHHEKLEELIAGGPAVSNIASLGRLGRLESLVLSSVRVDGSLSTALKRLSRLQTLSLVTADAIAPKDIPIGALTKLKRIKLSAYPSKRQEWIDFAMAHPKIGFHFAAPPPARAVSALPPEVEVVELHHGVEIVSVGSGRTRKFRIESDVAEAVGYQDSNGDLEDDLGVIAKKQKKKVAWGSEADTLVATCADLATCRWIIEQARALAKSRRR